jgi:CRISPR-associated protein Cmr5
MNTTAQDRSRYALGELRTIRCDRKEFAKLVAGLPAMILQNGLGHSLSFLLSKSTDKELRPKIDDKHQAAFAIVAKWLREKNLIENAERNKAVAELSSIDQHKYLNAQEEALRVLEWVKRYANAGIFE